MILRTTVADIIIISSDVGMYSMYINILLYIIRDNN